MIFSTATLWETTHFQAQRLPDVDVIQMWFLHIVIFSFPCMSSSSSPVRPRKPLPAVKACSTMFHAQPDCTARKTTTFCLFWTSFCWFQRLALSRAHIERCWTIKPHCFYATHGFICFYMHANTLNSEAVVLHVQLQFFSPCTLHLST